MDCSVFTERVFIFQDAASASDEALISDTESVGDTEEQKIEEQVKAINLNAPASQDQSEFTEEEEKKMESFKTAGNEAFKGTFNLPSFFIHTAD